MGAGWAAGRLSRRVPREDEPPRAEVQSEALVFASGNLGLLYFPEFERRATLAEIGERFPGLIAALAAHDGIGFVAGLSASRDPEVIGSLDVYGRRAAEHLDRELRFPNAPDLLVMSALYPEEDGVAAFEELLGSHGGWEARSRGRSSFTRPHYPSPPASSSARARCTAY